MAGFRRAVNHAAATPMRPGRLVGLAQEGGSAGGVAVSACSNSASFCFSSAARLGAEP